MEEDMSGGKPVAARLFALPASRAPAVIAAAALMVFGVAAVQAEEPEEEYGEFLARPADLASAPVNAIARSLRLNAGAMLLGKKVYGRACASCHGADLKGIPSQHTPDLTDSEWRFSGDDLESGGNVKFPSDVEWTVRYGIRSDHPNARGLEADMLAYDPKFRTEEDTKEFGDSAFLTPEDIGQVVEYVLTLGGQPADAASAVRGAALFQDGAKGNCFDCHGVYGAGNDAIGSTNLTRRELYLWGSDRASIRESIVKGRRGVMPAFEDTLKREEIKAVAVFVFNHARR
jgi:cytochrome c oxidase cbb3-type subunit III